MESAEACRVGAGIIRAVEAEVNQTSRFDIAVRLAGLIAVFEERADAIERA